MVMMAVGDGVRCGGVDGGCGVAAAERGGSGDDVWRGGVEEMVKVLMWRLAEDEGGGVSAGCGGSDWR
ncbi:hypothetical protein Tco_1084222 [Tanacetum coccineum]